MEPAVTAPVEVRAAVVAYREDAMHDSYDDGGFASFDASDLRVEAPEAWRGRDLTVYHDRPAAEDSVWREPGARLRFWLRGSDLAPGRRVFAGGLDAVERLDDGEGAR